MKKNKKLFIGLGVLVALIAVLATVYFVFRPNQKNPGADKHITVTVVYEDKSTKDFSIDTDEDYLRGALEQIKLISGSESEWGLYVTTVDNVTADDSRNQWWCFYLGDEMLQTGVDSTPVNDGDHYKIEMSTY